MVGLVYWRVRSFTCGVASAGWCRECLGRLSWLKYALPTEVPSTPFPLPRRPLTRLFHARRWCYLSRSVRSLSLKVWTSSPFWWTSAPSVTGTYRGCRPILSPFRTVFSSRDLPGDFTLRNIPCKVLPHFGMSRFSRPFTEVCWYTMNLVSLRIVSTRDREGRGGAPRLE